VTRVAGRSDDMLVVGSIPTSASSRLAHVIEHCPSLHPGNRARKMPISVVGKFETGFENPFSDRPAA
jgi:hypothetical protein